MPASQRMVVVGGGLAGLMTTIKICERGLPVDLVSLLPVKRSHSACAQGGINASVNTMGEGDSPDHHFEETVYGGDFLANQPPVRGMANAAPGIVALLDRMGVPFNRTPEGLLDFRLFGGTQFHRTAFAGATTGQQLLYALDEQVRRYEAQGLVRKWELFDLVGLVLDEGRGGRCVGVVVQDLKSMKLEALPGDAVALATGGPGLIFGRSTNSMICTGVAAGIAYRQGAKYANGEFIQVHPTAIPGADKLRLMSESARGEGGRIWVPWERDDSRDPRQIPEKDRYYFLEERYPGYGNLVPRDIASREIFKACRHEGLGIGGESMVYLDLTHLPREVLDRKLGGILEIYEKFVGDDPRDVPMKVFPAVHYSMGGLWVDFEAAADGGLKSGSPRNHQTNVPGLFAVGEVDYQYHGANRLGANSLLSCIYAGMVAGPAMIAYVAGQATSAEDVKSSVFDDALDAREDEYEDLASMDGDENPYLIHRDLGDMMLDHCTVERHNDKLQMVDEKLDDLMARWKEVGVRDGAKGMKQAVQFTRHLESMLILARVIVRGALARDESRGAHFKPAFPDRNDEEFLKTTIAEHGEEGPRFSYEAVDVSQSKPRTRSYATKGAAAGIATTEKEK
jgi:succinate dehydrogenase / fumarate reductase flavoprotein subunit